MTTIRRKVGHSGDLVEMSAMYNGLAGSSGAGTRTTYGSASSSGSVAHSAYGSAPPPYVDAHSPHPSRNLAIAALVVAVLILACLVALLVMVGLLFQETQTIKSRHAYEATQPTGSTYAVSATQPTGSTYAVSATDLDTRALTAATDSVTVAGSDGSHTRTLRTDTLGRLQVAGVAIENVTLDARNLATQATLENVLSTLRAGLTMQSPGNSLQTLGNLFAPSATAIPARTLSSVVYWPYGENAVVAGKCDANSDIRVEQSADNSTWFTTDQNLYITINTDFKKDVGNTPLALLEEGHFFFLLQNTNLFS